MGIAIEDTYMKATDNQSLRGTIIKVPDRSPGLLFVDGQQKSFVLGGVWNSPDPPTDNMAVEVQMDRAGSVMRITAVARRRLRFERLGHLLTAAAAFIQGCAASIRR